MSKISAFIKRWKESGGSEQANSQPFLTELCDVLGLERPVPSKSTNEENLYAFERKLYIPKGNGQNELKRLDLYKRGCFVLESKQGQSNIKSIDALAHTKSTAVRRGTRQWEDAMMRAKRQAENYVRCLPAEEGRPPFLIIADIGYCFDLYTEFSCTGGNYLHFPDVRKYRIYLEDLEKLEIQSLFRSIWNDPQSLDPSRRAARVTEEVAAHLADLAHHLETAGHNPENVSQFLMRCIFTMFAEDVGLIPAGSFIDILQNAVLDSEAYEPLLHELWLAMDKGLYCVALKKKLLKFNGSIFADPEILPLDKSQIGILLAAAQKDWKEVEPAIFGTLLERALDPKERHKLGAHYTPRAYVERLVIPTVMEPLRAEWEDVFAAASLQFRQGKKDDAVKTVKAFHDRLRKIKVLDPACGSGNFLYVTMEHMKRLEGEVLQVCSSYGGQESLLEITPEQFLGLEINPRAAHIAEMVLWIGYLQWHFRTRGNVAPSEPVIRKYDNIQARDALITWENTRLATDSEGKVITRWDGETFKTHPITGQLVPDESAVVNELSYDGVTDSTWPIADFIVGNPPFGGDKRLRLLLGDGYVSALRDYYSELPESCDHVMYWWYKAAKIMTEKKDSSCPPLRFGFITTNSITQIFNRRVVQKYLDNISLVFAIPDHPWVDSANGAAVRIAMTVAEKSSALGKLMTVTEECKTDGIEINVTLDESYGKIHADLRQGTNLLDVSLLKSNERLSCVGVMMHADKLSITKAEADNLGLGKIPGLEKHIRPYRNGKDITTKPRGVYIIDLLGLTIEDVRQKFPEVYQYVLSNVKPIRDLSRRAGHKKNWWILGEPRKTFRPALAGLWRYIVTPMVAKHRLFTFIEGEILPDQKLVAVASNDAFDLAVLSSRIHTLWATVMGGTLENRPTYNKTVCFDPFPFPSVTPIQRCYIRELGERLDNHRKHRQELYPDLTLTDMYNVLEALRDGRPLKKKEQIIYEHGLISILKELHDELDIAVAEAYGWPVNLSDEEILARLVALNRERSKEEAEGFVRWLRPEYQAQGQSVVEENIPETDIDESVEEKTTAQKTSKVKAPPKLPWPSTLVEQMKAVRSICAEIKAIGGSVATEVVAPRFHRANREKVQEILVTLEALGF